MFNSKDESSITVRAEGTVQSPSFQLEEKDGHILLKDNEIIVTEESLGVDKLCVVEPNYTSYQIYVPKNRALYISFLEGNFYSENFKGELNLNVEAGIIKLKNMNDDVNVRLNSGSVFLHDIKNTKIDAETSLGVLMKNIPDQDEGKSNKKLLQNIGNPSNSIVLRTILANIYLYESKTNF